MQYPLATLLKNFLAYKLHYIAAAFSGSFERNILMV